MASFEFYNQRAIQFQAEVEQVEKIIRKYAWSRVGLIALLAASVYGGFNNTSFFYITPILLVAFFFLVKKQAVKEEQKKLLQHLQRLNKAEANAVNFNFEKFSDGSRFADPHHPFGYDLDLFGKGSLFQYLNRCATQLGEEKLAVDLSQINFDKEAIAQRQDAVRDLGPKLEFRQRAWALGRQINDFAFDRTPLTKWLTGQPFIHGNKLYTIIKWALPAITCGLLALCFIDQAFQPAFIVMMIVQNAIAGFHSKKIKQLQNTLASCKAILENYSKIFELIGRQSFTSPLMQKHHQLATEASMQVRQFSALVGALESRMNMIAMIFGNGLFLYDFHSIANLEKWREQNAAALPVWLESLAEWDALLPLANLHYNHPAYTFGEVTDNLLMEGTDVGHPLIPPSSCIKNNFSLGNPTSVMLITGANMAGKSTFLRTIGVNFILAHIGSPVCATKWISPIIALRSGMRTSDSLQEHQSYFYAELHRLQSIMEELRSGKSMLILLDEILKGTNSTDKQLGSRELLKQLITHNALVLLATHDIALGDLEEQYPKQITNTCFEGKIEDGKLSFDYTLHKGIAQKANATFLMRQMGIIKAEL